MKRIITNKKTQMARKKLNVKIFAGFASVIILVTILINLQTTPDDELRKYFNEVKKKYSKTIKNNNYSILIDYRIPVFRKRLWIIKNNSGAVVLNVHVGHTRNSGFIVPNDFSNQIGSEKSCYGSFITSYDYNGNLGISMKLIGLEKNINTNAQKRGIVFHSWWIPLFSQGCFITFPSDNREIIEMTKNGSFVFVYK